MVVDNTGQVLWSPDGSQVAFANLCRLYVAPRVSHLNLPADPFGVSPATPEVYVAGDTYTPPSYMDIQFPTTANTVSCKSIRVLPILWLCRWRVASPRRWLFRTWTRLCRMTVI